MRARATHFLSGLFLILLGALFLMRTLGYAWFDEEYTVSAIFFTAGVVLLLAYYVFQKKIWTLILGGLGVFIGAAVFINEFRVLPDEATGILFFIITGLIFLDALRKGKRNWWALIPGGFCFIIASHILLDMNWWLPSEYHGVIFFGGMGLIFGIIYLLRDETFHLDWAKYPSAVFFAFAIVVLLAVDFRELFGRFVFPFILIVVGVLIVLKSLKKQESTAVDEKPTGKQEGADKIEQTSS